MRMLILGGTVFLGRELARVGRAAGHHVTCLARGTSGQPVEGVRFVAGDRGDPEGLAALDGETFDVVVDVTRRPSHARHAVAALAGRTGHWVYVSSVSVYSDHATPGQTPATGPILPPAPPEVDDPTGEQLRYYGNCKVSCEQIVQDAAGAHRVFVCRAGLIVGPEDRTARFPYWVERMARGGQVLAPGAPDEPVQLVDVRDLGRWLLRAAEEGMAGVYDGVSAPMPRAEFLAGVAEGVGSTATLTWVPQQFLQEHGVNPWAGPRSLPLWVPLPGHGGFLTRDATPTLAAGLGIRPLAETTADTYAWLTGGPDGSGPGDRTPGGGPAGGRGPGDQGRGPDAAQTVAGLTEVEEAELLRRYSG